MHHSRRRPRLRATCNPWHWNLDLRLGSTNFWRDVQCGGRDFSRAGIGTFAEGNAHGCCSWGHSVGRHLRRCKQDLVILFCFVFSECKASGFEGQVLLVTFFPSGWKTCRSFAWQILRWACEELGGVWSMVAVLSNKNLSKKALRRLKIPNKLRCFTRDSFLDHIASLCLLPHLLGFQRGQGTSGS